MSIVYCDTVEARSHKSPGVSPLAKINGFWMSTISSIPALAWKAVSMSSKMTTDPSAPPPLWLTCYMLVNASTDIGASCFTLW